MGFWDKVKSFFGGNPPEPPEDLGAAAADTARRKMADRAPFRASDIAEDTAGGTGDKQAYSVVVRALEGLWKDGTVARAGYSRTFIRTRDVWVYHPTTGDLATHLATLNEDPGNATIPVAAPVAPAAAAGGGPGPTFTPSPSFSSPGGPYRAATPPAPRANPYANNEILGLSAEDMRKRALRITPWRTAWIGRVDTIPPQSDERTALIDRGLLLRGLLSEEQLAEIHRVGDQWLKHHEAVKLAASAAAKTANEAVEERRRRKAALKAEKQRQAAERAAKRAAEVARRKVEDIVFLGTGVSGKLADRRANVERLHARGLPLLSTPADVAKALGLTVPRLRWLCFHSEAAERIHYVYFQVPKRSGGMRMLAAPHEDLARAQQWLLREVLDRLPTEDPAHGFIRGRSTVSNAIPHLGRDVVVNLDLSDFFPTITFPRVRGVFSRLGYSPAVATVLALLATESPRQLVEYDGRRYWVATAQRALPQGACTSPAISNQVARRLDRRLRGMAEKNGWTYTRYADDLTFSAPAGKRAELPMLMARVRHVVEDEGFAINPKKGRVQRAAGRQQVTGIVVNQRPALPREEVRRLRAILHGARKSGLASQNREGIPHFESWLRGKIAYLQMVDRERGARMMAELEEILGAGRESAG